VHLSVLAVSPKRQSLKLFSCFPLDVYNKIDAISLEQVDRLARQDHTVVISAEQDLK
jgi:ribosome-interacting GTPase 1